LRDTHGIRDVLPRARGGNNVVNDDEDDPRRAYVVSSVGNDRRPGVPDYSAALLLSVFLRHNHHSHLTITRGRLHVYTLLSVGALPKTV